MTNEQKIWTIVASIPQGRVASYGQVADLAGLPGRARFTSKALKAAPKSLELPWHRVMRSGGQIAFPAGSPGFDEQRQRLFSEGIIIKGSRIADTKWLWKPDLGELLSLPF